MKIFETVDMVEFPKPAGRDINMMPFVIGQEDTLPDQCRDYWSLIQACEVEAEEDGRIGYLTVTEKEVQPGRSQRRGGAHVERHPHGSWGGGGWGRGRYGYRRQGGLYMASNLGQTTAVWEKEVREPGPGGDCAHLELGAPDKVLDAGELVWMTDSCPHESLAVTSSGYRQFFRLVTSDVDLWYRQKSTENPLGVKPSENVMIIN